jgi:hypothetical protein
MACYLAWTPRGLSPYHATRSHTSYKVRARSRLRRPVSYCSVRHIGILWQNRHDRVMKYNLPRLAYGLGITFGAFIAWLHPLPASAQRPKTSSYGTSQFATKPDNKDKKTLPPKREAGQGGEQLPAPLTAEERDGNKLVALAAREVFRQKGIEAKVRQRVFAFGQEVVGTGEYFQLGSGQPKLLRLDMKMQVGPQAATLLQICGHRDYWIRRHVPPASPKLEHVNLTRLASALSRVDDDGKHLPTDHWILLGGLSRLVESLHRNFDFAPPQLDHIGTLPVLVMQGRLKPERFKELRAVADKRNETAEQIPTAVNLTLSRSDQQIPHFPCRIEFLRQLTLKELKAAAAKDVVQGNQPATETPLSTLEFDEVQAVVDLDPQLFEFDPGDEESEDKTQTWLRKLQE